VSHISFVIIFPELSETAELREKTAELTGNCWQFPCILFLVDITARQVSIAISRT